MREQTRYVLYARSRLPTDAYTRIHVVLWHELHQAHAWLREMIGPDEHTQTDAQTLLINSKATIRINADHLEEIINTPLTDWQVPDRYQRWILRYKYGTWDGMSASPKPTVSAVSTQRAEAERSTRAQRPSGFVTITDLALTWDMPATICRALLRASGRTKPEYGWAFSPDEIPALKELCGIT